MSVATLHPEELIERRRRGRLAPEERARLDAHARRCPSCALELSLIDDVSDATRPRDGDEALIDRMVSAAIARNGDTTTNPDAERGPATETGSHARRRGTQLAVFAAVATIAICAAAAGFGVQRFLLAAPRGAVREVGKGSIVLPPRAPRIDPSSAATEPSASAPPVAPSIAPKVASTAAELFTRANALRRSGDYAGAARAYRELQAKHPGVREEITSRVVLAQLLLDRLGDANGALGLFNSYLAAVPSGGLREEALVGRARALSKLGRTTEEASTWRQLLAAYPQSLHAERARKRLAELP